MLTLYWIIVFIVIWMCKGSECIRNAQLIVPHLVRAGSSVTLLCLYDLEHSKLYSVKWYRGNHEFFRFVPSEQPPAKVFPVAGISVDIYTSNQHQITLLNVPGFISGEVSCEITTDAPLSTACVSDVLRIQKMDIDIHVPGTDYRVGEQLIADCAVSTPAKLEFYLNYLRVPVTLVKQISPTSATLNFTISAEHFKPKGELRIQCSGGVSDQHYISTRVIVIRRLMDDDVYSAATNSVSYCKTFLVFLNFMLILLTRVIFYC